MGHGRLYSLCICFLFCCVFVSLSLRCVFVLFYLPSKENVCLYATAYVWLYIHTAYISTYIWLYEQRVCDYLHIDTLTFLSLNFKISQLYHKLWLVLGKLFFEDTFL